MKTQIVQQRILIADEGKYLTDGETFGTTVVLPAEADHSVWKEVSPEQLPTYDEREEIDHV